MSNGINNITSTTLKGLVASSILYIVIVVIGAVIAIVENLPAQAGLTSSLPVWQAFLYGSGTALSPALYWLIAQAILTALVLRRDRWGTVGVVGLIVFGLLFSVFGALEPIVVEIFNPRTFDSPKALIVAGGVVFALLMMAFGILDLVRRYKNKKRE